MTTASPYRTRSDLITASLGKLGVITSTMPPEVEDVAYVDSELDSIMRKLEALEIVFVPDRGQPGPSGGNIPGQWFDDLSSIIADLVKSKFGVPAPDAQLLTQMGLGAPPGSGVAAMSLTKMVRGKATYEVQRAEYF
jgi:hypothetical protein